MGKSDAYELQRISRDKGILRNKLFIKGFLETHPCIDCGNTDVRVLDFDHVTDKKEYHVSYMITKAYKLDRIKKEIAKCEIRCANCHRIVTFERRVNKPIFI